jgi:hypothetical protein
VQTPDIAAAAFVLVVGWYIYVAIKAISNGVKGDSKPAKYESLQSDLEDLKKRVVFKDAFNLRFTHLKQDVDELRKGMVVRGKIEEDRYVSFYKEFQRRFAAHSNDGKKHN